MQANILLIEDDRGIASALEKVLQDENYRVTVIGRGDLGLAEARQRPFDLVITDLKLPGLGGLELIGQLHAAKPKLPIIMITAHGTTETAIEAMKLGACEYLVKPFEADELLDLAASAVASSRRMSEPVDVARCVRGARHCRQQPRDAEYLQGNRPGRCDPGDRAIRGGTGSGRS